MSQELIEFETVAHSHQSIGWEPEIADEATPTWNCDHSQDIDETHDRESSIDQYEIEHNNDTSNDEQGRRGGNNRTNEDRDITLLNLEEEIGLKTPLEMRELPDLTHGFATWNVCNGFEAEKIAEMMLRCSLSILTIQEPRSTFNEIDVGFSKKTLLQYGIKGFFTKNQYLLFNERALGARMSNFSE